MRIGMSLTSSYPLSTPSRAVFDQLQEQIERMAELGFASLSLEDHHITRDHYVQNIQRLGITHILFRPALRGQQQALQTIRLLGTEVIPHFAAAV
ncbi:MAG: hypothetical protein FJZ47_04080 [Candidatus Tectomicrobia bacterium]|uniref:Luciferase-like domain-containing protein n=1 Tax=Tectimicrobiota bacterium TaxID=2528274 RepID=A0A937W010_UNCTE|nr:hypothetical protein [Candidatus Tectomicrobia bacterium]